MKYSQWMVVATSFFLTLIFFSCNQVPEKQVAEDLSWQFDMQYEQEIDSLIGLMTLEEKVGMIHGSGMFFSGGVERLGIGEMTYADGPLGIREEIERKSWKPLGLTTDSATFFPAGGGLSATWNRDLALSYGKGIGSEARARDKDILLAPAINIIRTPLCGRNYEYMSEDPFLISEMVVPYVKGVQLQDVGVCIKHYAVNNQETNRGTINVLTDERTLREIYLPGFKASVIEGQAYSLMGAYNKYRGDYLCENDYMLNTVLRDEWGFQGIVVSDWGAVHNTVKAAKNGLDVEMGSRGEFDDFYMANPLIDSVRAGAVDESFIDTKVKNILRVMYNVKKGDSTRAEGAINTPEHSKAIYEIASESIVLLKNDGDKLPLDVNTLGKVAVIGDNATHKHASGGFGAGVKVRYEVTPLEGLTNKLDGKAEVIFSQGYEEKYIRPEGRHWGLDIDYSVNDSLINAAVEVAKSADVAIVFAGNNRIVESEAADRKNIQLPFGQNELIKAVSAANPNTIVVIVAGAAVDLREVEANSNTIIWSWFNGSEGGNALADVILGNVNPSGKLPFTLPKKLEDSPAHATGSFPGTDSVFYEEGILVGYRWFDTKSVEPLFPFGYGLSYTSFEYADAATDKNTYKTGDEISVSLQIKNTGSTSGKEIVQVYVSDVESSVEKAAKELKGFEKVAVEAGGSSTVSLNIPVEKLAYFDEASMKWVVEPGEYKLLIGASSRDIRQELTISVE